ncbi:MAG: methyl-accepting chemotaxis protein [Candidatus Eremiobacterota bacterium]
MILRHWTFGQRIGTGFAAVVALALATGFLSTNVLRQVVGTHQRVVSVYGENLVDANKLALQYARDGMATRGYLLTGDSAFAEDRRAAREEAAALLARLRGRVSTEEERALLDRIERADADLQAAADSVVALRRGNAPLESVAREFAAQVAPRREGATRAIDEFEAAERRLREAALQESRGQASVATAQVSVGLVVMGILAALAAVFLTRTLSGQIGAAVGQVQSSSAELQAVANQQATGAREQVTAMSEIATTISELLATSRQIAESAQRVSAIAEQTASAAASGEATVDRASDAIGGIRRQVDLVVTHMLDLGKKSQHIGSVLEIVSELAEQTNILSINATIEAAGAGEAGKRFAVVADEIRKLADRVGGSTREIRSLIEDVRNAVNTTVMATETGSKAVDTGARQFAEVTSSFRQIAAQVSTTTEAAREIELSTKQQASAVEQVNQAIANVAQATRETESSTAQTLQTAVQLTALSGDLLRVVRPHAGA